MVVVSPAVNAGRYCIGEEGMSVLAGKTAVITGASQGIGAVFAQRLAAEGAAVVASDVKTSAAIVADINQRGGKAIDVIADVTDAGAVRALMQRAVETFGRLDILINNAAISSTLDLKPIDQISSEEWSRVMDVNVRGVFECIKAATPIMRKQQYGKIVNMGSGTFLKGAPLLPHYVASKGAVVGLTRSFARELGTSGIRINCISPGLVMTDIMRGHAYMGSEAIMQSQIESRAIKREQVPEDLAGAMIFLASPQSDFISGQTLVVDGGSFMH
jgi:NAD(P)-dependent dehydrogenase (short-subunit alcohol dehydrogenase family)